MRRYYWHDLSVLCEHCDGEHQRHRNDRLWFGRVDYLRGVVCEWCDAALDEMLGEAAA